MKFLIFLLFIPRLVLAGAGTYPQGDTVKMLKDILAFKTGLTIGKDTVNPTVVATPADAGSILITNGHVYIKEDAGMTTNWHIIDLPDTTGQTGKFLKNNGLVPSWAEVNNDINDIKNNLLNCASFENCTPEGVITVGSGFDLSGTTTRTVEASAYNASKLNVVGSATDTLSYKVTKSINFQNQQMYAYCEIKTSKPLTVFRVYADSTLQASLDVSSDNKWKYYKIPFVGGATSQEFEVYSSDTTSASGIDIDNCYIGKANPDLIQEVSEAHFVGKIDLSTNCNYTTTSLTYTYLLDTDSTCSATSISGGLTLPTNNNRAGLKILNPRKDGVYRIVYNGLLYKQTSAGTCFFTMSKTTNYEGNGVTSVYADVVEDSANSIFGDIRFTDTDDGNVYFIGKTAGSITCSLYGQGGDSGAISVHFYPDDKATIVQQSSELTANTANEFGLKVNTVNGIVISEDYDFINGDCSVIGTGAITCNFISGLFSVAPTCNASVTNAATNFNETISSITTSSITIRTFSGTTASAAQVDIKCSRSTSDINKSQIIYGKFENVNSSLGSKVSYTGTSNTAYVDTNDMPFSNKVKDTWNEWNGTKFTRSKEGTGFYHVSGDLLYTTVALRRAHIYKNGSFHKYCSETVNYDNHQFSCIVSLNKNEYFSIRSSTGTLINNQQIHQIDIVEYSDFESVIANLSKQKTKCQTKVLSANVNAGTTGVISDFTFNNLTIGKKYEYNTNIKSFESTTTTNIKTVTLQFFNGASVVGAFSSTYGGVAYARFPVNLNKKFIATSTTFTTNAVALDFMLLLATSGSEYSFVELCELPDNYIETTEF